MELGPLGTLSFTWSFAHELLTVIIINLVLSGDNAVAISMAVRSLPAAQRKKGLIFGVGTAVVLLVALTFFVSRLLEIQVIRLVGGILITWIAAKLLMYSSQGGRKGKETATVYQAVKLILIANITMSTDNVLAVGAAVHGNFFLLFFGLAFSIPLLIFASNLLVVLMDKYPVIVYVGAAILGRVGGEMIVSDPLIVSYINPGIMLQYGIQAIFAVGVLGWGQFVLIKRERTSRSVGGLS